MKSDVVTREYTGYQDCIHDLVKQGCKNLGWEGGNQTSIPKDMKGVSVYISYSGGCEVYLDKDRRIFYTTTL